MIATLNLYMVKAVTPKNTYAPVLFYDGSDTTFPVTDRGSGNHAGAKGGTPDPVLQGTYYDFTANGTGLSNISTPSTADLQYDATHPVSILAEFNFPSVTAVRVQPIAFVSPEARPAYGLYMATAGDGTIVFIEQSAVSTFTNNCPTTKATAGGWFMALGSHDTAASVRRACCRPASPTPQTNLNNIETNASAVMIALNGTGPMKLAADSVAGPCWSACKISRVYIIPAALNWTDLDNLIWTPHTVSAAANVVTLRFGFTAYAGPFSGTTSGWLVRNPAGAVCPVSSVAFAAQSITLTLGGSSAAGALSISYLSGDTVDSAAQRLANFTASATTTGFTAPLPPPAPPAPPPGSGSAIYPYAMIWLTDERPGHPLTPLVGGTK
jgi:hypothetical protein